jgi:hypothetical protein
MRSFIKSVSCIFTVILLFSQAYAKNDKSHGKCLPPGLEKKVARGKNLPPGWEKKLKVGDVLDKSIYKCGTRVPDHRYPRTGRHRDGVVTLQVEDKIIRLIEATREIIEILK